MSCNPLFWIILQIHNVGETGTARFEISKMSVKKKGDTQLFRLS